MQQQHQVERQDDKGGHDTGWMSETYLKQVSAAIGNVKRIVEAAGEEYTVIVTAYMDKLHRTALCLCTHPDAAESLDIRFTPTVIIRAANGETVFRAEGVPTVPQVLTAAVRALPA